MSVCTHLEAAPLRPLPAGFEPFCEDCVATGQQWVHLRRCLECEHVGCCDDSPGRHASAHFAGAGHPVMTSVEPGEHWRWCFVDEEIA